MYENMCVVLLLWFFYIVGMPLWISNKCRSCGTHVDTACIRTRIGFEPCGQMEIEGYCGVEIDDTYAVHLKLPTGDLAFCIETFTSDNLN